MVSIRFFALDTFSSSPALDIRRNHVYIIDAMIAHPNNRHNILAICIISCPADSVKLGVDAM